VVGVPEIPTEVVGRLASVASRYGLTPAELLTRLLDELEGVGDSEIAGQVADGLLRYARTNLGTTSVDKPFEYPGGDWFIKDDIIRLLARSGCQTLVEVFGGSGVISMYAPRNVFKVVVYNDKDDLVYSFFKALRENPAELARRLLLHPFSHRQYEEYLGLVRRGEVSRLSTLEKAVVFYYLSRTSFSGKLGKGFRVVKYLSDNRARIYARKVASLVELSKYWLDVVVENRDFRDVIRLYDSEHTVFYCDPPYVSTEETPREHYRLGFTHRDMRDLLDALSKVRGRFVLKLQDDNLRLAYIWDWVTKRGYRVSHVEHPSFVGKVGEGERREMLRTALVSDY